MRDLSAAKFLKRNAIPYLFLLPWLLGFFILTLYPMIQSLYLSFTDYNMAHAPEWIGLGNYTKMFSTARLTGDPQYLKSLQVTFTYVLVSVPLKLILRL